MEGKLGKESRSLQSKVFYVGDIILGASAGERSLHSTVLPIDHVLNMSIFDEVDHKLADLLSLSAGLICAPYIGSMLCHSPFVPF